MYAVISQHLVNKSHSGRTIIPITLRVRKDNVDDAVSEYITERANRHGFIKVEKFNVRVYDYKKRLVKEWNYIPTYR